MYRVYQVQNGDTIESIATKTGADSQTIIDLNGLTTNVTPGQLLVIPNQQMPFMTYTVVKGDSLYSIANKFGVNIDDLIRLNGLNKSDFIYPDQELLVPKENVSIYIVKERETINDVANKLRVDPVSLLGQNETIYLVPDQLIIYRKI